MVQRRPSASNFSARRLPNDNHTESLGPDPCHCVSDSVLENKYNTLRAEEHARKEGKCGEEWHCDVSQLPENASRNRYIGVVPWDHSRVILPVKQGENDYINASWIELGSRTYIATQGPMPSTIEDFWHMVYAYGGDSGVIIMLTPLYELGMEKCAKYWPDSKSRPLVLDSRPDYDFGLEISLKSHHDHNGQFEYSCFDVKPLKSDLPPHKIHHLYYRTWMDFSKPSADSDLRALIHLVNNELRNSAAPPIVHCSAGIGRTGTFIALDALLSKVDTDIVPAVTPHVVPFWRSDPKDSVFKKDLFDGERDSHIEYDRSGSPMLSKYDMSSVASKPPSIHSQLGSAANTSSGKSSERSSPNLEPIKTVKASNDADNSLKVPNPLTTSNSVKTETGSNAETENKTKIESEKDTEKDADQKNEHPEPITDDEPNSLPDVSRTVSGTKSSSALSGPVIKKITPTVTNVSQNVFSETPWNIDVMNWYDSEDPIMSTIRTMRKQRPKMVQGKQQLGYIYDQFEVGQQLARATANHNDFLKRTGTFDSAASAPAKHPEVQHEATSSKILKLVGIRRNNTDITDRHSTSHARSKWNIFKS